MPVIAGSTTQSTATAATAASAAVPPAFRVSIAASARERMRGRGHSFARIDRRAAGQMEIADCHAEGQRGGSATLAYGSIFCTGSTFTTGSGRGANGDGSGRRRRNRLDPGGLGAHHRRRRRGDNHGACSTTTLRRARRSAAAKPANRSTKQIATNSRKVEFAGLASHHHEFGRRAAGQQQRRGNARRTTCRACVDLMNSNISISSENTRNASPSVGVQSMPGLQRNAIELRVPSPSASGTRSCCRSRTE